MVTCEEVREDAAEYVLGVLDGATRASVVAHLASCASCRGEVAALARVTDTLWLAAPAEEPPPGFESRVLRTVRGRRRWLRAGLVAAAAAVLVAVGVVAGSSSPARPLAAGPMLDESRAVVGHAAVSGGALPYVHVSVEHWGESGTYYVDVVRRDGSFARVTSITLAGGHGTAGGPLPVPYRDVKAVWVTDGAHAEWCAFRVAS